MFQKKKKKKNYICRYRERGSRISELLQGVLSVIEVCMNYWKCGVGHDKEREK